MAVIVSEAVKSAKRLWRSFKSDRHKVRTKAGSEVKETPSFDRRLSTRTRFGLTYRRLRSPRLFDGTLVSIVMPTYNRATTLPDAIRSVIAQSHQNWELLIVDDGSTDATKAVVERFAGDPRIRLSSTKNLGVSAARNLGLSEATGSLVAYLDSDNTWYEDFLRLMVVKIVSEDLDCGYSGVEVVDENGGVRFYRGAPFDWERCHRGNYIDINAFVHRRSLSGPGFETTLRRFVDWDFILRVTREASVAYVPVLGCKYVASHVDDERLTRKEPEVWSKVVRTRHSSDGSILSWSTVARRLRLTFALKIAAPENERMEWGDFHFATSLASALEGLGHEVRIDFREQRQRQGPTDITLVLRGLGRCEPQRGRINVLWNISHPDKVSVDEWRAFDFGYSASKSHANWLRLALGDGETPVGVLMQCTDPQIFNPGRQDEASPYGADVLFVGNSRADFRPMVRWALEAGVDVEIYGRGWTEIVEDSRVHETLIDNYELGAAYATSRVVLNDHWESMRDFGIISNRVFDVTATGSRLISDRMPALEPVFGGMVDQVSSPEELSRSVADDGPPRNDRIMLADWITDRHSFQDRAETIVDDALDYLNLPRQSSRRKETEEQRPFVQRSQPDRIKVGVVLAPHERTPDSSAFTRLIGPLTTEHACQRLDVIGVEADAIPDSLDVLVVSSTVSADPSSVDGICGYKSQTGTSLVVDIEAQPTAFAYGIDESDPGTSTSLGRLLGAADTLWFPTERLRSAFPDHAGTVSCVIRNSIDPRIWRHYGRSTVAREGGAGSRRLLLLGRADPVGRLGAIYPQLNDLSSRFSFELFLVAAGNGMPEAPWLSVIESPGTGSYADFGRWLMSRGPFDIGLIPGDATNVELDFLEYSALGLLSVIDGSSPGIGEIAERKLAVLCPQDGWADALGEVFESPEDYSATRGLAGRYVWKERTVEHASSSVVSELETLVASERVNPENRCDPTPPPPRSRTSN